MREIIKKRILDLQKENNYKLNDKSINIVKTLQGFFGDRANCIGTNKITDYLTYYQMDLGKVKKYRLFIDGTEIYLRDGYCEFYDRIELEHVTELFFYTRHIKENIELDDKEKISTVFDHTRQTGFEQTIKETIYWNFIDNKELNNEYTFNLLFFWFVELYGYDKDFDHIKSPTNKFDSNEKNIKECLDRCYKFITLATDDIDLKHILNLTNFINKELKGNVDEKEFNEMDINLNETNFDQETTRLMQNISYTYKELTELLKGKDLSEKEKYLVYYEAKKAFPDENRIKAIINK